MMFLAWVLLEHFDFFIDTKTPTNTDADDISEVLKRKWLDQKRLAKGKEDQLDAVKLASRIGI